MSSDKIRIDTDKLEDISQQLSRLSSSLASIDIDLSGISVTAHLVVSEEPDIIRNINSLKNRVSASRRYAYKLSGAVQNASARWAKVETELTSQALGTGDESASDSAADGNDKAWDDVISLVLKLTGGIGAGGKIVSAICSAIYKGTFKDLLKSSVDIIGDAVVKLIVEGSKGTKANWAKALIGFAKYAENATEAYEKVVEKLTGAGNWITNGIKATIDNWDLIEDNPWRFVTETVSETTTNVILGSIGTAAAVAFLGPTAPAIVVGLAGAGIVWAADKSVATLVNKIGKDVFHADININGIADGVGQLVGTATDYVTSGNMLKDLSTGLKAMWDTGSQAVSDMFDTTAGWFGGMLNGIFA